MNKTAIVTGGSKGIGLAISLRLGLDGYNIVILSRSKEEDVDLSVLQANNIPYLYVQGSVAVSSDRQKCLGEALRAFGAIHVLVNNAGVAPLNRMDLLETTEESFDRVISINTKGTYFMSQLVAKQMLTQDLVNGKRGSIINISSCSSVVSSINRGEYCVSKAGISMITKLFAHRLAEEHIYVFEVRPGVIHTDMTEGVKEKYDNLIADNIFPIQRWGMPEDVANAVSVFCSDNFLYSTGNYIDVDGGFHIQRL